MMKKEEIPFNSFNLYDENANLIDELIIPQQNLLFVHQNTDQKRIIHRYGNNVCLLDATYKTTKYAIPLFFVATTTSVDCQVIGFFCNSKRDNEINSRGLASFEAMESGL